MQRENSSDARDTIFEDLEALPNPRRRGQSSVVKRMPVDPVLVRISCGGLNSEYIMVCYSNTEQRFTVAQLSEMLKFFKEQRRPGAAIPFGQGIAKAVLGIGERLKILSHEDVEHD